MSFLDEFFNEYTETMLDLPGFYATLTYTNQQKLLSELIEREEFQTCIVKTDDVTVFVISNQHDFIAKLEFLYQAAQAIEQEPIQGLTDSLSSASLNPSYDLSEHAFAEQTSAFFSAKSKLADFLKRRVITSISQYQLYYKSVGLSKGFQALSIEDNSRSMIKTYKENGQLTIPRDQRDWIQEYITAPIYKRAIRHLAPDIELVTHRSKQTLFLKSNYLQSFKTLKAVKEDFKDEVDETRYNKYNKSIRNFEKVFAAMLLAGEVDYHASNLGVMHIGSERYAAKIDHGRSAFYFYSSEAELRTKFNFGYNRWCNYGKSGFVLNIDRFKQAVHEINQIQPEEIETLLKAQFYKLFLYDVDVSNPLRDLTYSRKEKKYQMALMPKDGVYLPDTFYVDISGRFLTYMIYNSMGHLVSNKIDVSALKYKGTHELIDTKPLEKHFHQIVCHAVDCGYINYFEETHYPEPERVLFGSDSLSSERACWFHSRHAELFIKLQKIVDAKNNAITVLFNEINQLEKDISSMVDLSTHLNSLQAKMNEFMTELGASALTSTQQLAILNSPNVLMATQAIAQSNQAVMESKLKLPVCKYQLKVLNRLKAIEMTRCKIDLTANLTTEPVDATVNHLYADITSINDQLYLVYTIQAGSVRTQDRINLQEIDCPLTTLNTVEELQPYLPAIFAITAAKKQTHNYTSVRVSNLIKNLNNIQRKLTQYSEAEEWFVTHYLHQLRVMKDLEKTLDMISKLEGPIINDQFRNGGWLAAIAGEDPIKWADEHGCTFNGYIKNIHIITTMWKSALLDKSDPVKKIINVMKSPQNNKQDIAITLFHLSELPEARKMISILKSTAEKTRFDLHHLDETFILAAKHNKPDVIQLLLELGINRNAVNESGETALMVACRHGHINVIKQLLELGVEDIDKMNNLGDTALTLAAARGDTKVTDMLKRYGAQDPDSTESIEMRAVF